MKEVYYLFEDEATTPSTDAPADSPTWTAAPIPAAVAAPVSTPTPSSGPVASIADEPLKTLDTLRVIIAHKPKKRSRRFLSLEVHKRSCWREVHPSERNSSVA